MDYNKLLRKCRQLVSEHPQQERIKNIMQYCKYKINNGNKRKIKYVSTYIRNMKEIPKESQEITEKNCNTFKDYKNYDDSFTSENKRLIC